MMTDEEMAAMFLARMRRYLRLRREHQELNLFVLQLLRGCMKADFVDAALLGKFDEATVIREQFLRVTMGVS